MRLLSLSLFYIYLFVFFSCQSEEVQPGKTEGVIEQLALRLGTYSSESGTGTTGKEQAGRLSGYLFKEGTLFRVYPALEVSDDGIVSGLDVAFSEDGRFYLLSNAGEFPGSEQWQTGSFKESDFQESVVSPAVSPENGMPPFMTGSLAVRDMFGVTKPEIVLTHGYARLDMEIADEISIESLSVDALAPSSYLFAHDTALPFDETSAVRFDKQFDTPLTGMQNGVCNLYEQAGGKARVKMIADIHGVKNTLTTELPGTIRRNHIYTLKVTDGGARLEVTVQESAWETGDDVQAAPDLTEKVLIDREHSLPSPGVRFSEARDTVFVPYWGANFQLALDSEGEVDLTVDGNTISVRPVTRTRSTEMTGKVFEIDAKPQAPGVSNAEYVYLRVHAKNLVDYYGDHLVLVREPSRTLFSGEIAAVTPQAGQDDRSYSLPVSKYVDGTIGYLDLPSGSAVAPSFTTGEDEWLRIEPSPDVANRYTLSAGYRPNDPRADGRLQKCLLSITHSVDGVEAGTEKIEVSRVNAGLPVIPVDGVYWCKFNLLGNSRKWEDQIHLDDPLNEIEELDTYLANCPEHDFYRLAGHAYKGINPNGMSMVLLTVKFEYEFYSSYAPNGEIGSSPTSHCPPGYQIPNDTQWRTLFTPPGNVVNMGTSTAYLYFNGGSPAKTTVITRYRREISLPNADLGVSTLRPLYFKIAVTGFDPVVISSLGHQWSNTSGISDSQALLATAGQGTKSWQWKMEADGTTVLKLEPHNNQKTRTIRCIKTPGAWVIH